MRQPETTQASGQTRDHLGDQVLAPSLRTQDIGFSPLSPVVGAGGRDDLWDPLSFPLISKAVQLLRECPFPTPSVLIMGSLSYQQT